LFPHHKFTKKGAGKKEREGGTRRVFHVTGTEEKKNRQPEKPSSEFTEGEKKGRGRLQKKKNIFSISLPRPKKEKKEEKIAPV